MEATGIVRKVDELRPVVLPVEQRRTLGLDEKDPLGVYVDGGQITPRKYQPACVFASISTAAGKLGAPMKGGKRHAKRPGALLVRPLRGPD